MAITVICEDCSESHRVKDDTVGKKFKCKGCGKSINNSRLERTPS